MKSVCQSIWLYLMRLLYDPTGGLVFALGVVVSLVFSAISFKSEKTLWKCALLFIVLTLLVGYGIHYSKKNYTYVPDIYFDNVSLEYAYSKLDNANLVCPRNQQNFDNKAMEHLEKGNNLSDHNFVVTGSDPAPGEFVKQGSSVILSVTWADVLTAINITKEEHKDFDPMEFYGDPEHAVIYDYSIGSLWLRTLPVGLKAVINGTEEHGLEVYPPKTEKSIVRGCLVDYFTNEVIDEAVCYLGDEIFSQIFVTEPITLLALAMDMSWRYRTACFEYIVMRPKIHTKLDTAHIGRSGWRKRIPTRRNLKSGFKTNMEWLLLA